MNNNREPGLATILRYLVYASAFVPLVIFSDFISPFHFGKVVVFRSLVYVMAAFYVPLIWRYPFYRPKMTGVHRALLFFSLIFSLTTATSAIVYPSFWGTLERMGGLFTFWHYFVFFLILTSIIRSEKDWIKLFNITVFVGVLSALYGFGQKTDISFFVGSGNRSRIFGTIGNPALFAGYQILCIFLALTFFFRAARTGLKIFYAGSAVIMAIAVMITAVRGSMLGLGVGILTFLLIYSASYKSKTAKKILFGLVAAVFLFIIFSFLFKDSAFVKNSGYLRRITDLSIQSYTVKTRFWAWEAGLKGWAENPKTVLLGWGPENFNIPFSKYFNPLFYEGPGSETLFDRAHNMFVEILVTMGLAGLLAYLWIFFTTLRVLWKKLHSPGTALYGTGLISLVIAYAIHNSFIFDTSANFLVFFTVLGFISFLDRGSRPEDETPDLKKSTTGSQGMLWLGFFLFILAVFTAYRINILPVKANYATTRAIIAGWNGDFKTAIKKYREALSYDVMGKYEYRHRMAKYILDGTSSEVITPELAEIIKFAIEEVNKNIIENEGDYLPYLYAARLYINLGKDDPTSEYNDKSLEHSMKALEISPTFVRTNYEIAQAHLNKKNYAAASEYFKKALDLNPKVGQSHWYYAVSEIQGGNVEEGLRIAENAISADIYEPSKEDLDRMLHYYLQMGDFAKIAWAYEFMIQVDAYDPQHRASLAFAYAKIGKFDKAVEQAREAFRLDKNYEAEARAFVEAIGRKW